MGRPIAAVRFDMDKRALAVRWAALDNPPLKKEIHRLRRVLSVTRKHIEREQAAFNETHAKLRAILRANGLAR